MLDVTQLINDLIAFKKDYLRTENVAAKQEKVSVLLVIKFIFRDFIIMCAVCYVGDNIHIFKKLDQK